MRYVKRRSMGSVILPLIIANIVVFVMEIFLGNDFINMFILVPSDILTRPWIILTSMFMHSTASMSHIFFNMYGLFIFGPLLEQKIGPKNFLLIYMVSGILAGIGHSLFSSYPALGASGAIMGMIGTLIILMPDLKLLFFFLIPMPLWIAGIVWAFLDFFGIFFPTGIGNIAHLVGMGTGLLFGLYLKSKKRDFDRRFSKKHHITIEDVDDFMKSGKI